MLDLTAPKILILLLLAVVLLGPKRLPEVARQVGAGWRRLRQLHARMDQEVRRAVPDLPSNHDLARLARSPVAFLDQLAALPGADRDAPVVDSAAPLPAGSTANGNGHPATIDGRASATAIDGRASATADGHPVAAIDGRSLSAPLPPADDPGMN